MRKQQKKFSGHRHFCEGMIAVVLEKPNNTACSQPM